MIFPLLDAVTLLAYVALALDLLLEIRKVKAQKHSADISFVGIAIRTSAATIILVKFFVLNDYVLLAGQVTLVALLVVYLALIYSYSSRV